MTQAYYGAFGSDATGKTCQYAYFDRNQNIIGSWSSSNVYEAPAGSGNYYIDDTPPNRAYFISFRITTLIGHETVLRYVADSLKPEKNAFVFNFTGAGAGGYGKIIEYRFYDTDGNQTGLTFSGGVTEVVNNVGVYLCVAPNVPTDAVIVIPNARAGVVGGPSIIVQDAPDAAVGPHAAIKKAVYELFTGDAALMALVKAVGDWPVPGVEYPYITYRQGARMGWRSKDTDGREVDLMIHIWTEHRGFHEADTIQDRVFDLLINNILQLDVASGYYAVATALAYDESRELIEEDAGKSLRHVAMPFEIQIKEVS